MTKNWKELSLVELNEHLSDPEKVGKLTMRDVSEILDIVERSNKLAMHENDVVKDLQSRIIAKDVRIQKFERLIEDVHDLIHDFDEDL